MEKNEHGLSIKEEKFCQLVVEFGDQTKAYRASFDVHLDAKDSSHHVEGSKLASKFSQRISDIRKELALKEIMTKEDIMQHLKDILNMTKCSEKEKAIALKALDQYTKMVGGYEPEKLIVDNNWKVSFGDEDENNNSDA